MKSQNTKIQALMRAVDALEDTDEYLEEKLQKIAEAVAREQQKMRREDKPHLALDGPIDPQDAFTCDGCQ